MVAACAAACGGGEATNEPGGTSTSGHRISVAITNLQGNGTVVQLNGANDQSPLPTNSALYFTNIAKGTQFTISVKTQPSSPWQTCTVGNGTGTMNDADIDGPTMTCALNAYKVGGTVSGLTGAGLTMVNGAGTPVAIAAGISTFAFAGIQSGTGYTVKVASQPAGQTCAVNNASGTVTNADVTNVTVACGATGFIVSGSVSGLASAGLALGLNGGAPLTVASTSSAFAFASVLQTGNQYSVVVTATPPGSNSDFRQSCALARARGKIGTSDVTDVFVSCRANAGLAGYDGVYALDAGSGRRDFLMLLSDGTYSFADRSDDPTCPQNGNGTEYGVYSRAANGSFSVRSAMTDRNGGCGIWDSQANPAAGMTGTMSRNNDVLTLTTSDGTYTLTAVASVATSLVGAFTRADGVDGSFVVFEPDGTYLYQEAQDAGSLAVTAGWERGCYTVSGATFTTTLASSCKPSGLAALDLNGGGGFSAYNGTAIPFTIDSPTSVTIDGRKYRRLVPAG
jgi:hypothetical protein